jgi:transcriptional regulator with XRE-family HTH domain
MDTRSRVGAALRRWRLATGLTQVQVAERTGKSQSSISAAEDGIYSADLLCDLLAVYRPSGDEALEVMVGEPGESA